MDWSDLLAFQGTLKSLLQHHSSKAFTGRKIYKQITGKAAKWIYKKILWGYRGGMTEPTGFQKRLWRTHFSGLYWQHESNSKTRQLDSLMIVSSPGLCRGFQNSEMPSRVCSLSLNMSFPSYLGIKVPEGGDICVFTTIDAVVWWKTTQHCKAIYPPIKNKFKKILKTSLLLQLWVCKYNIL